MAESKREKIERLKREAEEKAKARQEEMKKAVAETDTSDSTDELIKEAARTEKEPNSIFSEPALGKESIAEDSHGKESIAEANPNGTEEKTMNLSASGHEVMVSEAGNEEYVRIRVTSILKNEAKSVRKQILIKPSVMARVDSVLTNQYKGVSFNNLVNQLLEGWLSEVDAIEVEKH